MRKVTLGKSGLEVSAVGFGGIPIQRISQSEAVQLIRHSLDLGLDFIDTAAGYGDSEEKIGAAIEGRRDGLTIATKSGRPDADGCREEIERSLKRMKIERIDLFQFHGVSSEDRWAQITAPGGAMETVLKMRDEGKIAHIGYTSHSGDMALKLADEEIFETVQFPFNLVTREPAEPLIAKARENDLGFIVMKPLCGGQYGNAELAFKFLNAYPDLVPIPGIQEAWEIEQILQLVDGRQTLEGEQRAEAQRIADELGKLFCRRCGYCQPCPQGVPISMAMIFTGMIKRMPPEKVKSGPAAKLVETAPACIECGQCETQCPYDLPIIETIKTNYAMARELLG